MHVTRPLLRSFVALIVSMVCLTSVATADQTADQSGADLTTISGQLFYRERIAPAPGSIATITLDDVSRADARAVEIAQLTLPADRIPVSFAMGIAKDRLDERARYVVRGTITDGQGGLLWTTDTAYVVDAGKDVTDLGMMRLVQVGAKGAADTTTRAVFICGDKQVVGWFSGDTLDLEMDGQHHRLTQVRAASGARYEDSAGGLMFWEKGKQAFLEIGDGPLVACTRVELGPDVEQPTLEGAAWRVEDIDGRGVIDNSQTTLTFGADNRVSGRAGCNTYSGSYRVSGDSLSVDGVAVTMMACLPELADQEAAFLDILNGLKSVRFSDTGALLISDAAGRTIKAQR